MTTALTVYGTNAANADLSTARLLVNITGASGNGLPTNKIGTNTGYFEVYSGVSSNVTAFGGSLGAPSGNGWLFDTTLEDQQIPAGTWTCTTQVNSSTTNGSDTVCDFYVRAYKLANDLVTYTAIGNMTLSAQHFQTTLVAITLTGSLPAMSFGIGDKLYLDVWMNCTTNNTGNVNALFKWTNSNSATQGRANNMQVVTPGYNALVTSNVVVTSAGLNLLRDGASGANNPLIKYIALGTSGTTPNVADTQLGAEVFRKTVTTYTNGSNPGEVLVTGYIGPSDAVGVTIAEVGYFGGASASATANSGVLVAHGLYTLANKTALESVQIVLDLTI